MANTYTQIYIHAVFVVKERQSLIRKTWKDDLYKYITGIINNNGHKLLVVNGMPDHIHIFISMKPEQSVSELIQKIKSNTSRWVNDNKLVKGKFSWQRGFGAFSYSQSQINKVINYIENQEEHHKKKTFKEEYKELLEAFSVEYDNKYIFKDVE